MRLWIAIALVWLPRVALAEAQAATPNITVNIQPSPAPNQYRGQQILSDSVFGDVGKEPSGPGTSKSAYSGAQREVGAEPDYNTAQRAEWMARCESFRNTDAKGFRDCFNEEKRKALDALRTSRDIVERRQSSALRNSQGVPDLGTTTRDPAFGGVESESSDEND